MRARPVSPARLVDELADRVVLAAAGRRYLRVALDGAPSAHPGELADTLVDPLRARGHPVVRVDSADFLRPASIRYELGRHNPDGYYERWFDLPALAREVLDPLDEHGSGRILTTFWNPDTDRATRAGYTVVPVGGVLLLSGPLLLGTGLAVDLSVHCAQSPAALRRRTPPQRQWTLPAFERYATEVAPVSWADVVLRMDDPAHPALVLPGS